MVAYEYSSLRSPSVPATINVPLGWKWNQMGPMNAQRVDDGHDLYLNVTGLAPTCSHKYVHHGQHDDDIKIQSHDVDSDYSSTEEADIELIPFYSKSPTSFSSKFSCLICFSLHFVIKSKQ